LLFCNKRFQFLDCAVLFDEVAAQLRVHRFVAQDFLSEPSR